MMRFRILHSSAYCFDEPRRPEVVVQLRPRERSHQRTRFFQLACRPLPEAEAEEADGDDNLRTRLLFREPLQTLRIIAVSEVDHEPPPPNALEPPWERQRGPHPRYLDASPRIATEALGTYGREAFRPGLSIGEALESLIAQLHRDLAYERSTDVQTSAIEALAAGRGQCQDFAQIAIGSLRAVGIAARYVGGHFLGAPHELHAWVSLRTEHGWLDFDPTLRRLDARDHITVAVGRDRGDVSPIEGLDAARLDLAVSVERRPDRSGA